MRRNPFALFGIDSSSLAGPTNVQGAEKPSPAPDIYGSNFVRLSDLSPSASSSSYPTGGSALASNIPHQGLQSSTACNNPGQICPVTLPYSLLPTHSSPPLSNVCATVPSPLHPPSDAHCALSTPDHCSLLPQFPKAPKPSRTTSKVKLEPPDCTAEHQAQCVAAALEDDQYVGNFTRLSDLQPPTTTPSATTPRTPARATPKKPKAAPRSAPSRDPEVPLAAPKSKSTHANKVQKGRWRFHNGQKYFIMGKQKYKGQTAWRMYQKQQKQQPQSETQPSKQKSTRSKKTPSQPAETPSPAPKRRRLSAPPPCLTKSSSIVKGRSSSANTPLPSAATKRSGAKQNASCLVGIDDDDDDDETTDSFVEGDASNHNDEKDDDATEMSDEDFEDAESIDGGMAMPAPPDDSVAAIVAKYCDISGGDKDPELQAALNASLQTAAKEHVQRLCKETVNAMPKSTPSIAASSSDPNSNILDSGEDDLPILRSKSRQKVTQACGPRTPMRQATLAHCFQAAAPQSAQGGDGPPKDHCTSKGSSVPNFLKAPFRPNVVGSGLQSARDYYDGGAVDSSMLGVVYETVNGWAH